MAMKAKITIGMLGGMIIPLVVAATVMPAAYSREYPRFSISGMRTDPIEAASATEEPEMPEMIMLDTTQTMPSPPRSRPTRSRLKSISRAVSPPWFIIAPMSTYRGRASMSSESIPE